MSVRRVDVVAAPLPGGRVLVTGGSSIDLRGETVVSVQRTQGRMRHTDMKTNVQWPTTWTIRDGKVLRAYGYLTRAEALEAAGLRE